MRHAVFQRGLLSAVVSLCLIWCLTPIAHAVESIHFQYQESYPTQTDAIRLSTRIGYTWFSSNVKKYNVENGAGVPYAYHDGYVEWIGATSGTTKTPADAAARWRSILTGGGDPWTGQSGATIGTPTIILLDEITMNFTDAAQGPSLKSALQQFIALGGTKSQIVILVSPALSMSTGSVASDYDDLKYCANNYCRYFVLEVYVTMKGFLTGYDPDETAYRGTGDTYLSNRLTYGIRKWTTTFGVTASKVMPMILVCNRADKNGSGGSYANYYQFLNRCMWFMANGWYTAAHASDANVKTALRNGVGTYTWEVGSGDYQITLNANRDTFVEKYIQWYSVGGNLAAHSDGVTPPP